LVAFHRHAILTDGSPVVCIMGTQCKSPVSATGGSATSRFRITSFRRNGSSTLLTLDQAMKAHIEQALALTQGRIEGDRGAAKLLDINPHTLRARMRKLGIRWSSFRQ
ncbi:MAG: helix-turn-helix domain-containing protein, partial [Pirellulaceae bacterium]